MVVESISYPRTSPSYDNEGIAILVMKCFLSTYYLHAYIRFLFAVLFHSLFLRFSSYGLVAMSHGVMGGIDLLVYSAFVACSSLRKVFRGCHWGGSTSLYDVTGGFSRLRETLGLVLCGCLFSSYSAMQACLPRTGKMCKILDDDGNCAAFAAC